MSRDVDVSRSRPPVHTPPDADADAHFSLVDITPGQHPKFIGDVPRRTHKIGGRLGRFSTAGRVVLLFSSQNVQVSCNHLHLCHERRRSSPPPLRLRLPWPLRPPPPPPRRRFIPDGRWCPPRRTRRHQIARPRRRFDFPQVRRAAGRRLHWSVRAAAVKISSVCNCRPRAVCLRVSVR